MKSQSEHHSTNKDCFMNLQEINETSVEEKDQVDKFLRVTACFQLLVFADWKRAATTHQRTGKEKKIVSQSGKRAKTIFTCLILKENF